MELSWDSLKIHTDLKNAITKEFNFEKMTSVQAAAIPLFVANNDLTVEAVTGSGKTFSFVVPILEILIKKSQKETSNVHDIGAIVVSPTRELACQTYDVFLRFEKQLPQYKLKPIITIGGSTRKNEIKNYVMNGGNIVVATPGRLLDLFTKCPLFGQRVRTCLEVFVLDEADQLLSLGFEKALNDIIAFLPKLRRTCLFSATQSKELDQLIRVGFRNPLKIEVKEKCQQASSSNTIQMPSRLNNRYFIFDTSESKIPFLIRFVRQSTGKFVVFLSTCAQVDFVFRFVRKYNRESSNLKILKLHRKLNSKRSEILKEFKEHDYCLLLCTDLMSRGVDIPKLDWVIHFDLPTDIEIYVHRCGRSGHQQGIVGNSLLFCLPNEMPYITALKQKGILITELETTLKQVLCKTFEESLNNAIRAEARRNIKFFYECVEAFVSFVRSYTTKQFMNQELFKECDIVDVANSYGLLKMPSMRELKRAKKTDTVLKATQEDSKIADNFKSITYNKKQKLLKAQKGDLEEEGSDNELSISKKKKQLGFKRNPDIQKMLNKSNKLKGKIRRDFLNDLETEELNQDARVVKKLKRGKISNLQFDQHFGL